MSQLRFVTSPTIFQPAALRLEPGSVYRKLVTYTLKPGTIPLGGGGVRNLRAFLFDGRMTTTTGYVMPAWAFMLGQWLGWGLCFGCFGAVIWLPWGGLVVFGVFSLWVFFCWAHWWRQWKRGGLRMTSSLPFRDAAALLARSSTFAYRPPRNQRASQGGDGKSLDDVVDTEGCLPMVVVAVTALAVLLRLRP